LGRSGCTRRPASSKETERGGCRALDILIALARRAGEVVSLRTERGVAEARRKLHDDQAFDGAWNEGRSMTLAEAVRYALDV
jgi:hypothetical protein